MEIKELMAAFAAETGVDVPAADADGTCHLEIDEMPVMFRNDGEGGCLVTQGEVAYVPEKTRRHLWRILMESMYLWAGTDGASFVVEPVSGRLLLQRTDALKALDVEGFKAMLEAFANTLAYWRQLVAGFGDVGEALATVRAEEADRARRANLGMSDWVTV